MSLAAIERPLLRVALAPKNGGTLAVAVPVLGGSAVGPLFPETTPAGRTGHLRLFRAGEWLMGAGAMAVAKGPHAAARELYHDVFAAAHGLQLARIWNYVPAINEADGEGLENYRAFCRGRSVAFEEEFGATFKRHAPAGSAVGCEGGELAVVFAACAQPLRHVENPRQIPAYEYPPLYGPRAPTFARATIARDGAEQIVFVSGTAAIQGHASFAPGDTRAQLTCTLENLREISRACGLGLDLGATQSAWRHFNVYVRRAAEQPVIAARLQEELLRPGDAATYLRADICRRELNVEIEAVVRITGR